MFFVRHSQEMCQKVKLTSSSVMSVASPGNTCTLLCVFGSKGEQCDTEDTDRGLENHERIKEFVQTQDPD